MINRSKQLGGQLVEFAIVGLLFFIIMFAVFEFARLLFVWNALHESTRRGVRIAAVCPVNDPAIANVTVFDTFDGTLGSSPIVNNLTTANVGVSYLDVNGAGIAVPDPNNTGNIQFVQVSISNFTITLFIPVVGGTFSAPSFTATLPVESLGAVPTYPDDPPPAVNPVCLFNTP